MERGEELAALSVVAVVGVLATITLLLNNPTGQLTQGEEVYPSQPYNPIACEGAESILLLKQERRFDVYCCPEDMIGQNECKEPHTVYH